MPQGARTERVGEEFREILAEEIQKLKDPRVGFVTVTGVQGVAGPARRVGLYTALGDDRRGPRSRAALRSAAPHLRRELGRQVRLKVDPRAPLRGGRPRTRRGSGSTGIIEPLHGGGPMT